MDLMIELAQVPLFTALPRQERVHLARIAKVRKMSQGGVLFSEGDLAEGFYVIVRGQVKVYKLSPAGKEQTLRIFGPQQPVGEAAMFSGEAYPAHAECLKDTELLFFPRQDFLTLVRQYPEVALMMLGTMARRLMYFTRLVEDLSLKEVPTRFAAYLLRLSEHQGNDKEVDIEFSKKALAGILGATPETLSRILSRLTREKIISATGHRHVKILDRKTLCRLSKGEVQWMQE